MTSQELITVATLFQQGKMAELEVVAKKALKDEKRPLSERLQLMYIYIDGLMHENKKLTAHKVFERATMLMQVTQGLSPDEYAVLVDKWTRLSVLFIQQLKVTLFEIKPPFCLPPNTSYSNNSVVVHNDELVFAIRSHNYRINDDWNYQGFNDVYERFISEVYIQTYDLQNRVVAYHHAQDKARFPRFDSKFLGYEDPRIFKLKKQLYFTATNLQVQANQPRIVLCRLNADYDIDRVVALKCPDANEYQKNWLPFVEERSQSLLVIYRMSPFTVLKIDPETGAFTEVLKIETPHIAFPLVKGSCAPIPWGDGYLFVIHYTMPCRQPRNLNYYYHRFVWMDKSYTPQRMSESFYVHHRGTEFISGLAHYNNYIYLSMSATDERAYMCRFTAESLNHFLSWFEFTTGKTITTDTNDLIPPKKLPSGPMNDFTPAPLHLKTASD